MVPLVDAQSKLSQALEHLKSELGKIRTGRANPQILEGVMVDAYGSKVPINQVGTVSVVDASLMTVNVWDKSLSVEVIKALEAADLGFGVSSEGDLIRVTFPPLSEERRVEYVKLMKDRLEETRIAVRVVRKDVLSWIDAQDFSEDEKKGKEKELQTSVDKINEEIEEIGKKKEQELMTV